MNKILFNSNRIQLAFLLLAMACLGGQSFAQNATLVDEQTTKTTEAVESPEPVETSAEATAPEENSTEEATLDPPAEETTVTAEAVTDEPQSPIVEDIGDSASEENGAEEEIDVEKAEGIDYAGLIERSPDFFAVTHPAVVHFPIALWIFGAFFIVVGWIIPSWGQQIPFACLIFGTLGGIVATLTGWWYADFNGYGDWQEIDWSDGFFQHRWLGVALSAASIFITLVAFYAVRTESRTAGFLWKLGLLLIALGVGYEGHLGGALIHSTSIEEAFVEWITPSE